MNFEKLDEIIKFVCKDSKSTKLFKLINLPFVSQNFDFCQDTVIENGETIPIIYLFSF